MFPAGLWSSSDVGLTFECLMRRMFSFCVFKGLSYRLDMSMSRMHRHMVDLLHFPLESRYH